MEFRLIPYATRPYRIMDVERLTTPCLLVFRDRVEGNIAAIQKLLRTVAPGFPMARLWPHVKTHKSAWITRKMLDAGVTTFKASPNEVQMLLEAGVPALFVAYPPLPATAGRLAELAARHPNTRFFVQIAHRRHAEALSAAAERHALRWDCFIDVDAGMHRTGIAPAKVPGLARAVFADDRLRFAGLHVYGGHNHAEDPAERRRESERALTPVADLAVALARHGLPVPRMVVGGTPSFVPDLEFLTGAGLDSQIVVSPGTWIYFDTAYHAKLPGAFEIAALALSQVIDRTVAGTATLNLGVKRWSMDNGPVEGFSVGGMRVRGWSEEHTVVDVPGTADLDVGDYVLVAPRHVCTLVNLYERMTVVGPDGAIEAADMPIEARNR